MSTIITLREQVDITKLQLICDNFLSLNIQLVNAKKGYVKDSIEESHQKIKKYLAFKKKSNLIEYGYTSKRNEGRMYCKSKSSLCLASMPRVLRYTIGREYYDDIDIKNCHPEIFKQLCERLNFACPQLIDYTQNRNERLQDLIRALNIEGTEEEKRDEAKKIMLSILNGGTPDVKTLEGLAWLKAYYDEMNLLRGYILARPEYKPYLRMYKDKTFNKEGSAINQIFCKYENDALQVCLKYCKDNNVEVGALCFDGFMIYKNENINKEKFLQNLSDEVYKETQFRFKFEIKEMGECLDLTNMKEEKDEEEKVFYDGPENYFSVKEKFEDEYKAFLCVKDSCFYTYTGNELLSFSKTDLLTSFANIKYNDYDPKGEIVRLGFIKRWVEDENIKRYTKLEMYPPPLECPKDIFNTWEGFAFDKYQKINSDEENINLIRNHIRLLCDKNEEAFQYIEKWILHIIQYPAIKENTAILIKGPQGIGKDTIADMITKMIGDHLGVAVNKPETHIFGDFNSIVSNKIFIKLTEMNASIGLKYSEKLKELITEKTILINTKGKKQFSEKNLLRLFMSTNKDFPIKVEETDRRYVVIETRQPVPDKQYFDKLYDVIEDMSVLKYYVKVLNDTYGDLKHFDFSRNRPKTEFFEEIKYNSKDPEEQFLRTHLADIINKNPNQKEYNISAESLYGEFRIYTAEQNINNYNSNKTKLGCRLKKYDLKFMDKKIDNYKASYIFNLNQAKSWLKEHEKYL